MSVDREDFKMSGSFINLYDLTFTVEIQTEDKCSVKRGRGYLRSIKGCLLILVEMLRKSLLISDPAA